MKQGNQLSSKYVELIKNASSREQLEKLLEQLEQLAGDMRGAIKPDQKEPSRLIDLVNLRLGEVL